MLKCDCKMERFYAKKHAVRSCCLRLGERQGTSFRCVLIMGTGRFEVELGALQAFTNDERTRSFLALEAATCTAEVRGCATIT